MTFTILRGLRLVRESSGSVQAQKTRLVATLVLLLLQFQDCLCCPKFNEELSFLTKVDLGRKRTDLPIGESERECVCVSERERVRACVCVCVRACEREKTLCAGSLSINFRKKSASVLFKSNFFVEILSGTRFV